VSRRTHRLTAGLIAAGHRFLPFADAASEEMPLSRLLRLSLFQISVGMSMVLLVGTLNRVMIVELGVPASLVAIMFALPMLAAPFRALIGFRSDNHRSELGWRRVPYIWMGTLLQFGGFAIMPFALLVLAGAGHSADLPAWVGQFAAGLAFLLVGIGLHVTQTVGLALATDQSPVERQPSVVGLMYVMLLLGMMGSAFVFGELLTDFSPGRLVQVIQGAAITTLILNTIAIWKQEARSSARKPRPGQDAPSFAAAWKLFSAGPHALRRLWVIGLGTMAFTMEDVLLEPYGGEILGLSVGATTSLTATLALGGLAGFGAASWVLNRGADPFRIAGLGALLGLPAFALVIAAGLYQAPAMFPVGVLLIGLGAGLFGHGTLTVTMNHAPREQTGLALGAWGAVQASATGLAIAAGGLLRDLVHHFSGTLAGYVTVYAIETVMLVLTLLLMRPLLGRNRPVGSRSATRG
jgi:BCD family chlorophyll transporter-like MFS transporter